VSRRCGCVRSRSLLRLARGASTARSPTLQRGVDDATKLFRRGTAGDGCLRARTLANGCSELRSHPAPERRVCKSQLKTSLLRSYGHSFIGILGLKPEAIVTRLLRSQSQT
jgi:hypothetical protein